ncbi:hypothetical protein IKS57_05850 [bacterium]|nr:hypothetical protein [bacterium]
MTSAPTTLPSYVIQSETPITFKLVVFDNADSSAETITSNAITINPTNTTIKGAINTTSSSSNTLNIYSNVTGSTQNSYIFNLDLTQNNKTYEGSLTGAVTT